MLEIKNLSSVVGDCLCKCEFEKVVGEFLHDGRLMPQYSIFWVELGQRDPDTCLRECSEKYSTNLNSIWCR